MQLDTRYPVSAFLDGRLFVRFQLDVGGDVIIDHLETVQGIDWLGFYGIPSPTIAMISVEQQFAEKLHAYSLPRPGRLNTRVKDLVDMVLLAQMRPVRFAKLKTALKRVFETRQTHPLPQEIVPPPPQWAIPYNKLAKECGLNLSLKEAYEIIANLYLEG